MPGRLIGRRWQHDPVLNAPPRYRRACAYDSFVPDELSTLGVELEGNVAGLISDAEEAIRQLNQSPAPALRPLSHLLLRSESIGSSKVEDLQIGARALARAEARAESGGKPAPTAIEVLANIDAMVLAVEHGVETSEFGLDDIVAIHRRLLERVRPAIAGRIRRTQNWIGGNDYNPCGAELVPPPPEELDRLLADLGEAINADTLSPLVHAALVHAQFEAIHPFEDGNGRTGRALIHVVLRRRGLAPRFVPPISIIFAGAKHRYIDGLAMFRGDGVAAWIEQFATAAYRAARLARAYVDAVRALQESWRESVRRAAVRAPRADAVVWAIIDLLPAHPMISAPVVVAATGRAKSRVYEGIEQLVEAGVLLPLSEGKRNRWWEAAGLLDLIEGLDAGEFPGA